MISGPACTHCGNVSTKVIDVRTENDVTKRKRSCTSCGNTFHTYEQKSATPLQKCDQCDIYLQRLQAIQLILDGVKWFGRRPKPSLARTQAHVHAQTHTP